MAFLWLAVENRMNMLIIGGTASGKTTMMNSISFFIPYNSKIVSLEDTREIQLPHKNWLPMVTRDGIDLFDLLKAALRQRPEYILVGEIRGREAITLFQAMNTGHITYSTLHAGSIESAINRLIHEPINVPIAMFDSLDMVITLSLQQRKGVAVRRMLALHEISLSGEKIKFKPIFRWDKQKDCFTAEKSDIFKKIEEGMDVDVEQEIRRRSDFLRKLAERRALKMHEIVKELNNYT
jgi:flagellar protein FlaI